ncbi:acyl-CoA dehydrogenase [bacterium]|jgi:alkylation response protein AidB-like acyl-CoA dehydrogenase|nr:acyl-CoA dehydrogenase [bacterium]
MYKAPIEDMKFVLRHQVGLDQVAALHGMDMVSDDLVDAVLEEAGKLASDVLAPLNHSGDMAGSRRNEDGTVTVPDGFAAAWRAMAEGGWIGLNAAPDYGGQGLPQCISAAVNEIWNASNMGFALCQLLSQGAIHALEVSGDETQKTTYLPKLNAGEWTGTMNLTEPQAGTDLAALRTMATPDGDHYRIKGQKIYITYGEHEMAENIIHLVLARTPDAPAGVKGISLFIVPKYLVNADGSLGARNDVHCLSIEKKLGIKASPTAVLQYGQNEGAIGYLLGQENKGLDCMFLMMNSARYDVGLQGLAISDRAYQHALAYTRDRVQGTPLEGEKGQPILHHPDVLRLMTVMKAEIEAMRAVLLVGGGALDKAHYGPQDSRAEAQERANLLIPIIKGWMTERSLALTSDAVQVHGGMGFIEETGAAQHYRDARILPIYEGTTAIQANDLVFRKTLRDNGAAVRALLAEIADDMTSIAAKGADLAALANGVQAATTTALSALDTVLARANSPRSAAAGGVDFLMLLGYLAGGWQMARAAAAAAANEAAGHGDPAFMKAKQATARAYGAYCLPEVGKLAAKIDQGPDALATMSPDWL